MPLKTIGQIKKGIKSLKESEQFVNSSLANIEKVFRFELDIKRKAKKKIDTSPAYSGNIKKKIEQGEQIADFSRIEIHRDFLIKAFHKICEIRKSFNSEKREEIKKIEKAIDNGKIDFMKIQKNLALHKLSYFNTLSKKISVSKELLHSISLTVYGPIFELCVEMRKDLIKDYVWKKGSCPFCGTNTAMAKFEKEVGKRILWCPLCGAEWVYKRMECPFCGNDDHELLRFFYLDDKSPYRVDVCDVCKGYIKTVDERKRDKEEKTIFEIEDMRTLYLNDIAEKEGFKKI